MFFYLQKLFPVVAWHSCAVKSSQLSTENRKKLFGFQHHHPHEIVCLQHFATDCRVCVKWIES